MVIGLLLGIVIGLALGPLIRSWMVWQEYAGARRGAAAADLVVHRLEAQPEARRPHAASAKR
jgi:hypothetical protein